MFTYNLDLYPLFPLFTSLFHPFHSFINFFHSFTHSFHTLSSFPFLLFQTMRCFYIFLIFLRTYSFLNPPKWIIFQFKWFSAVCTISSSHSSDPPSSSLFSSSSFQDDPIQFIFYIFSHFFLFFSTPKWIYIHPEGKRETKREERYCTEF